MSQPDSGESRDTHVEVAAAMEDHRPTQQEKNPRASGSPDAFSRRVEAAVPEALDFLPGGWTNKGQETARALVERVLAAADRAVPMVPESWDGLLAILDVHYPAQVFTGESGDVGARIVVLTRELARLRAVEQAAREVLDCFSGIPWRYRSGEAVGRLRSALSEPAAEGSGE